MLDHAGHDDVQAVLAANLRRLRIARHLSLSELARATRMSKATLSSIENGRANPTVDTLAGLAGALRISIVELLAEMPLAEVRVVRATQGRLEARDGIPQRLIDAIAAEGAFELAELALAARESREAEPKAGGSRVSVYVLQGKLITGPVERSTELGTGDYVAFPADVPYVYQAGRHPARALVLSQEPS
jgi:XRE family transcriptional regulator, regulator of sulfur utilization